MSMISTHIYLIHGSDMSSYGIYTLVVNLHSQSKAVVLVVSSCIPIEATTV